MDISTIKTVANLGAGTMGHATTLQFAMYGYHVNLLGHSQAGLERAQKAIAHDLDTFIKTGVVKENTNDVLKRITYTTDYASALKNADFVIESIIEDLEVKQQTFAKVEKFVRPEVVLATNTSGLSPSQIQSKLQYPNRFVVAHFWNPAQLMPLVEVVPGKQTAPEVVEFTTALMNHIGKHAVPLKKESLGFVGNRIQLAVLREALHIVDEGIATPQAVDDIVKYSLGRRWNLVGPIASADLGGLNISAYLYQDLANDTGMDPALEKKLNAHQLGLKTGQGFYTWQGDQAQQIVDQRDQKLLEQLKDDQEHPQK